MSFWTLGQSTIYHIGALPTSTLRQGLLAIEHILPTLIRLGIAQMAPNPTPIWLVNGASSGFGKAITAEALQRGHRVIATARKTTSLADLGKTGASILSLDVTWDDTTIAAKVHEASAIYGCITHLVNCAGYMMEGMIEEMSS